METEIDRVGGEQECPFHPADAPAPEEEQSQPGREDQERPIEGPALLRGDARALPLKDNTVDLVCAHPPYADIIRYSQDQPGDLSHLGVEPFLRELCEVADECFRVTRPEGVCTVLMGDTRKRGNVVPLGMRTLGVFQEAGFDLKEIVIKAQHNTRMEGTWAPRAAERNFLLLAHEYLFILTKPRGI